MVSLEFFIYIILGLNQPLTELSTRNISWGKGGRCVGLTTLPPSCADCPEIWEPRPSGTLRACPGMYRNRCTFWLLPCQRLRVTLHTNSFLTIRGGARTPLHSMFNILPLVSSDICAILYNLNNGQHI
jgi:hypothetical protein